MALRALHRPEEKDDIDWSKDRRFVIFDVAWDEYVAMREALEDHAGLDMTYLDGVLELMSPSRRHEEIGKMLARLIEIWAVERNVPLNGYKSETFRKKAKQGGCEPDECYFIGLRGRRKYPDIAVEVEVSRSYIQKLEVYQRLQVREVWFWRGGRFHLFHLEGTQYREVSRSVLLPDLDVDRFLSYLEEEDQTSAVRSYRQALRDEGSRA